MATIRPLELGDQSLVTQYLKRYPPEISELTFTNLFVWRNSRPVWLAEVEDSLVFLANARGENHAAKVVLGHLSVKLPHCLPLRPSGLTCKDSSASLKIRPRLCAVLD